MTAFPSAKQDPFERVLRETLRTDGSVAVPARLQDAVARAMSETPVAPPSWWRRANRGPRTLMNAATAVTAAMVVAFLGGSLLLGVLTSEAPDEPAPIAGTSPSASIGASPSGAPIASATPVPPALEDPRIAGDGPWLTWATADPATQSQTLDPDAAFAEYRDVEQVGSWGETMVGVIAGSTDFADSFEPMRVVIRAPDGTMSEREIDVAMEVAQVVVGPAGIIVRAFTDIEFGDAVKAQTGRRPKLPAGSLGSGPDENGDVTIFRPGKPDLTYSIYDYKNGLAKYGYRPDDLRPGQQHSWYAEDGETWRKVRAWSPDARIADIVATQWGFVATGGDEDDPTTWTSTDGLTWTQLLGAASGSLHPWPDGALVIGDRTVGLVTKDGYRRLPELSRLIGPGKSIDPTARRANTSRIVTGDIGLVYLSLTDKLVLFSPDGESWSLTPTPEEWFTQCRNRQHCRTSVNEVEAGQVLLDVWMDDPGPSGKRLQLMLGTPVVSQNAGAE